MLCVHVCVVCGCIVCVICLCIYVQQTSADHTTTNIHLQNLHVSHVSATMILDQISQRQAQHTQCITLWSFDRQADGVIRVVCSESAAEATTTTDTAAQTCVETLSSF